MLNQNIRVKKNSGANKWKAGFFILLMAIIPLSIYCFLK